MTFTVRGVAIRHGETTDYRHRGYKTSVTPVLLAGPYKGFPAETQIGTIQSRRFTGRIRTTDSGTFTGRRAVRGHDYDWLVREFQEEQGGERKARLARIQPGRKYVISHMFGYLSHDPCIYERGDRFEVKQVTADTVVARVLRSGAPPIGTIWNRESFESLVTTFTAIEEPG